jgi:hypothetical protein
MTINIETLSLKIPKSIESIGLDLDQTYIGWDTEYVSETQLVSTQLYMKNSFFLPH